MGAVHRAKDGAGRIVALKVLAPQYARDERLVERFRREARAAGVVRHPNVVACLDSGEGASGPWIAFELVPGGSLRELIARRGPLPWRDAVRLGAEVARGLAAIHAAGLIHRDVKPGNVLLDSEGRARVADLGIARGLAAQTLTVTGEVVGTFEYLAPELAGEGEVDFRADLYALGATLHEALTGRPPFSGQGMTLITKHVFAKAPSVRVLAPDVPAALDALVQRLMSKHPGERGTSAAAVASELEKIDTAPRRSSAAAGAAGAAVLLLVLLAVVVIVRRGEGGPGPGTPPVGPAPPPPPPPAATSWFLALTKEERVARTCAGVTPLDTPGRFRHDESGIVLVYVPATRFLYGEGDGARETQLSPFFIGETEITNAEIEPALRGVTTLAENGSGGVLTADGWSPALSGKGKAPTWRQPDKLAKGDILKERRDHPVVQVSWGEAHRFACAIGPGFDLPTEAQWVCAAHWDPVAKKSRTYPWGEEPVKANLADRSFGRAFGFRVLVDVDDGAAATSPVRAHPEDVSAFGLLGAGGNASEWCRDKFDEKPPRGGRDPYFSDPDTPCWVVRGGSWTTGHDDARVDHRRSDGIIRGDTGFRVVLEPRRIRAP